MKARASILIVDDDDAFRGVLTSELRRMDFEVHDAGSGETALERLTAWDPDVVLLGLRLPGMSGLDTLKAIREGRYQGSNGKA